MRAELRCRYVTESEECLGVRVLVCVNLGLMTQAGVRESDNA